VSVSDASDLRTTQWNRREFLKTLGIAVAWPDRLFREGAKHHGVLVNDIQTESNPTYVSSVVSVRTNEDLAREIAGAHEKGLRVSTCGARHASGGQEFGSGTVLLDTRSLNRVLGFDQDNGTIEVEGGTMWPDLMSFYLEAQRGQAQQWGIAQKQGGLDRLTMGGTLSANAHGHTLTRKPIVGDIESFELINASGNVVRCSRNLNPELFQLAIGGYGLFGVISRVKLRLIRRQRLVRRVRWGETEDLAESFEKYTAQGALYGDFQYSIDSESKDFIRRGILTAYVPADSRDKGTQDAPELSEANLAELLYLAHTNKAEAFQDYARASLRGDGRIVWSDTHQYSPYPRYYHHAIDQRIHAAHPGTDTLAEVYVPRGRLADFLDEARAALKAWNTNVIYGTVRFIRRDDETFLPWAREDYACVIFTIHVTRDADGLAQALKTFHNLTDFALGRGGSFYMTYQRFADRKQIASCYPRFADFLVLKQKYDPTGVFDSDWYRHYKQLFDESAG
jgi:FAD/FMN-containing dehydrogenase